ncbi:MAG: hemerythrin domain-containing protein [Vicinamibacterales bacterium]
MAKRTIKQVAKKTARRKVAARATATRQSRARAKPKKPTPMGSTASTIKGALAGAVASVTRRLPGAPDALARLEADHRRIEELFKRGEKTTARGVKTRSELLRTIDSALNAHELIEEKILYPALRLHPEAHDIVLEGIQEHHVADLILKELRALDRHDEQWGAKFKVLKENIEHHIQEEEGPMFRSARGLFSRDELREMGVRMSKMKAQAS